MKTPSRAPARVLCLATACAFAALAPVSLRADPAVTITYDDGDDKSDPIDTSAPNDPTALDTPNGSATQSGVISGTGAIIKTGGSNLTLTADNNYSGGTTINDGTLIIGDGGTTGSIIGNVNINGASSSLRFYRSDDLAFAGDISGVGGLWKAGAGTLTLSGANSYEGGTIVGEGTLSLGSSGALGSTGAINFVDGILQFTAANTTDYSARMGDNSLIAVDTNGQSVTFASQLGASHTVELRKTGAGTLMIAGVDDNTNLGLTLSAGTVVLAKDSSLTVHAVANIFSVASGATLQLGGTGDAQLWAANVNGLDGTLDLNGHSDSPSYLAGSGVITNTAAATSSTLTVFVSGSFAGNIQDGAGTVALTNDGTFTLSGTNTYTGATTNYGILQFTQQSALASWTADKLIVNSGGIAIFNVGGAGEFDSTDITTLAALGTNTGGFQSGSYLGLDTSNADGGIFSYSDNIANPNGGANSLGLSKYGTGTLVLGGANTYTGGTTVFGGTLQFAQQSALPGTNATWSADKLIVNDMATATFNVGGAGEFTSADITTLAALGTDISGFLWGSTLGLDTTNAAGGIFFQTGLIANPNGGNNSLGLSKFGDGTLVLSGANTYTGNTYVDAGTLQAGVDSVAEESGAFGLNSTVSVNSGAVLDLNGHNTQIGGLYGSGDVMLGAANLTVGGSNTAGTFSGTISGDGGSLTKTGGDIQLLLGANTYTGATTVTDGTLSVGGSTSADSVVTVQTGSTLAGNGTIGGATTIQSGGTLAPGGGNNLTFGDDLTLNAGSFTSFQVNGSIRGASFDSVDVNGTLTYGGELDLVFNTTIDSGLTLSLFGLLDGSTGHFSSVVASGNYDGLFAFNSGVWTFFDGMQTLTFSEATGDLSFIEGSAVPEPATYAAIFGACVLALAAYRRRVA